MRISLPFNIVLACTLAAVAAPLSAQDDTGEVEESIRNSVDPQFVLDDAMMQEQIELMLNPTGAEFSIAPPHSSRHDPSESCHRTLPGHRPKVILSQDGPLYYI